MDITIVISNSEVKQDVSIKPSESFNPNLRKIYEKPQMPGVWQNLRDFVRHFPWNHYITL